eukprot:10203805-Alexandrium_andersonii.AAC.1
MFHQEPSGGHKARAMWYAAAAAPRRMLPKPSGDQTQTHRSDPCSSRRQHQRMPWQGKRKRNRSARRYVRSSPPGCTSHRQGPAPR